MQTAKQLSVSLVNKPGRLADMLTALNKGKVNFQGLGGHGFRRAGDRSLRARRRRRRRAGLGQDQHPPRGHRCVLVEIPSQPGGFRNICERLAAEHLNIDYAYCAFDGGGKAKGGMLAVIKVNDLAKAQRVLSENATVRKKMPFRRPVLTR